MTIDGKAVKAKVVYNLCNYLNTESDCGKDFPASRAYAYLEDKKCVNLLPRDDSLNDLVLLSVDHPETYTKVQGFYIKSKQSNFKAKLVCQATEKGPIFEFEGATLVVKTIDACGYVDSISEYIANNRIVFCLIFIFLGLILLFFGGSKWEAILGIFGFLIGAFSVLFFFYILVNFKNTGSSFAVIGSLALLIGIIVGYLAYNSAAISYIIIGFPSGYLLTNLLLALFTHGALEDVRLSVATIFTPGDRRCCFGDHLHAAW